MAGLYFFDPRPFYFLPADYKVTSLDDLFKPTKKDPKPADGDKKQPDADKKQPDANKKKPDDKKGDQKPKNIELKVSLCCQKCVRDVKRSLEDLEGVDVDKIDCDELANKVTVPGHAKPEHVLNRVRKVKREAELWTKK